MQYLVLALVALSFVFGYLNSRYSSLRVAVLNRGHVVAQGHVDEMLSSMLIGIWLTDPNKLHASIDEFVRVLRPGGVLRIYPTPPPSHSLWKTIGRHNLELRQTFFAGTRGVLATPPGYTAHLRKAM